MQRYKDYTDTTDTKKLNREVFVEDCLANFQKQGAAAFSDGDFEFNVLPRTLAWESNMSRNQPKWKLIANLGDVNPIEYGGYFVYVDETDVYPPEAELLCEPSDECGRCHGVCGNDYDLCIYSCECHQYTVYRFILERCTLIDGILSDNRFHPEHMAWFGYRDKDRPQDSDLNDVASFAAMPDIAELLCSANPIDRACAYRAIGEYHGFENLDSYPLTLTRAEAEACYDKQGS